MRFKEVTQPKHPFARHRWVAIVAQIRENATGKIVDYDMSALLEDGAEAPNPFGWTEGDYSCGINRRDFFRAAAGLPEDPQWCDADDYSVRLLNSYGEVYYSEF